MAAFNIFERLDAAADVVNAAADAGIVATARINRGGLDIEVRKGSSAGSYFISGFYEPEKTGGDDGQTDCDI